MSNQPDATGQRPSSYDLEVLGWRVMHGDGMTKVERELAGKVILEAAADARGEPRSETERTTYPGDWLPLLEMFSDTHVLLHGAAGEDAMNVGDVIKLVRELQVAVGQREWAFKQLHAAPSAIGAPAYVEAKPGRWYPHKAAEKEAHWTVVCDGSTLFTCWRGEEDAKTICNLHNEAEFY